MARLPRPVLSALLLCDQIIREEGTHKASLIGIVRNIRVPRLPVSLSELWVYALLTDAEGEHRLRLDVVRLQDLVVTAQLVQISVRLHDRANVGELVLKLGPTYVESPGLYEIQLLADDRLIGARSFTVVQNLEDF
ncbi:MAG: DUF6941 family protein [Candidatus Rokuibacteriota bacterium]